MSFFLDVAGVICSKYPLLHLAGGGLSYGTAGFRTRGVLLPPVAARLVCVAVLRGVAVWVRETEKNSRFIATKVGDESSFSNFVEAGDNLCCNMGLMITASHNSHVDNGFKVVDYSGQSIPDNWEYWFTKAVNSDSTEAYVSVLNECQSAMIRNDVCVQDVANHIHFFIGTDSRPSGKDICHAVVDVFSAVGVAHSVLEHVSTPQLHEVVLHGNLSNTFTVFPDYYERKIVDNFKTLFSLAIPQSNEEMRETTSNGVLGSKKICLVIDTANGVGGIVLDRLLKLENDFFSSHFDIKLVNTDVEHPERLNYLCGADYVNRHHSPSREMEEFVRDKSEMLALYSDVHCYSLDGDADRVVALDYVDDEKHKPSWVLMDGDRFSVIFSLLLLKWLGKEVIPTLNVGVVQTAYANGASTLFVENVLKLKTYLSATGVKNVHPIAESCDIGIYFEANGHGTVLFNLEKVANAFGSVISGRVPLTPLTVLARVHCMSCLLSQVCGDAIADLLMCEVALKALNMRFRDIRELYKDFPSIQRKVTVPFPKRITTISNETRAVSPDGFQEEIDKAVEETIEYLVVENPRSTNEIERKHHARSFARASGTESIVRVYCETSSKASCEYLSEKVCKIVQKYCT